VGGGAHLRCWPWHCHRNTPGWVHQPKKRAAGLDKHLQGSSWSFKEHVEMQWVLRGTCRGAGGAYQVLVEENREMQLVLRGTWRDAACAVKYALLNKPREGQANPPFPRSARQLRLWSLVKHQMCSFLTDVHPCWSDVWWPIKGSMACWGDRDNVRCLCCVLQARTEKVKHRVPLQTPLLAYFTPLTQSSCAQAMSESNEEGLRAQRAM